MNYDQEDEEDDDDATEFALFDLTELASEHLAWFDELGADELLEKHTPPERRWMVSRFQHALRSLRSELSLSG
jgi:hypothetical protein